MSNDRQSPAAATRIRRRDSAAVAGLCAIVLIALSIAGALPLVTALIAIAASFILAAIYHLTVSTSLPAPQQPAPEEPAPAPPAARDPVDLAMFEKLPLPVLLIGPGGRIDRANPAARDFLGLGSERGHLSAALRQPKVLETVSAALKGVRSEAVEYSMMAPIESHVRAFVTPIAVRNDPAFPWRAMLVLADETTEKRTERMRADFLANASHELRTPLASLAGFIETLRGHAREDVEARDKFLAIMHDQTERMRRLIDDLLSLSRVEMDEHLPPSGHADLPKLTEDVIDFLRPQLDARRIGIEYEACADAQAVGDRDQLVEVVQNLVENAVKYSPEGSRLTLEIRADCTRDEAESFTGKLGPEASRLTLTAAPPNAAARFVLLRVRDNGKGMERRNLPRLTERFFRVDGQKSGPREGTGLGLAIVKHIINRHRGGFVVESAPGIGSIFTIYLPAYQPAVEIPAEGEEERHRAQGDEAGQPAQ